MPVSTRTPYNRLMICELPVCRLYLKYGSAAINFFDPLV